MGSTKPMRTKALEAQYDELKMVANRRGSAGKMIQKSKTYKT